MGRDDVSHHGASDSDRKFDSDEIETRPVARQGFGSKVKRHCARFWWVHLIIFCICFLIIALPLVYVGMPKIAQHDVDRSTLEFTEIKFLDPTPNSLVLAQKAVLHNPSKFTPTLDSFNASLVLLTNGNFATEKMTSVLLPEIHALHGASSVDSPAQKATIENLDQVTEFATQALQNEIVETALVGKTKLHLGALPVVDIDYNTTSTYKGLNGLKGFNVTDMRIDFAAKPGESNLKGIAFIPNPSVMSIAMGNVTLVISTEAAGVVGNSTINDMTIVPGDNHFPMTGVINQSKVISSLQDGFVDLLILGDSSIYNGQHLTYYEKALSSKNLTLHVNIKQVLADSAEA